MKKDCCKDTANLTTSVDGDKRVDTCKVCSCRHIRLSCEPGRIGLTGHPIGGGVAPDSRDPIFIIGA